MSVWSFVTIQNKSPTIPFITSIPDRMLMRLFATGQYFSLFPMERDRIRLPRILHRNNRTSIRLNFNCRRFLKRKMLKIHVCRNSASVRLRLIQCNRCSSLRSSFSCTGIRIVIIIRILDHIYNVVIDDIANPLRIYRRVTLESNFCYFIAQCAIRIPAIKSITGFGRCCIRQRNSCPILSGR